MENRGQTLSIGVISLFPEMFQALTNYGINRRAINQQLLTIQCWNPRDYTLDRHATVDDRPYGGGPGMVMKVEPLLKALQAAKASFGSDSRVIYLSPQGRQLNQTGVEELDQRRLAGQPLILLAGRYEGIDERFINRYVDEEWSIGDYVLSGGELPAMVLVDALVRQVPGALGHEDSAMQDSFVSGLLDCPHYTRPEEFAGQPVPSVLLSGNHEAIKRWRLQQSLGRTWQRRPDLLAKISLNNEQQQLLDDYIQQQQLEN